MASTKKENAPKSAPKNLRNYTNKKSKSQLVLKHLKTHKKGITSWDAFERYNATRLSAIIFNLRQYGYDIVTITEETSDGTRYARYILKGVA